MSKSSFFLGMTVAFAISSVYCVISQDAFYRNGHATGMVEAYDKCATALEEMSAHRWNVGWNAAFEYMKIAPPVHFPEL